MHGADHLIHPELGAVYGHYFFLRRDFSESPVEREFDQLDGVFPPLAKTTKTRLDREACTWRKAQYNYSVGSDNAIDCGAIALSAAPPKLSPALKARISRSSWAKEGSSGWQIR